MGRIGLPELLFIFLVILLLFGAKRLPEIGSAIGKAIKEFQKAIGRDGGDDRDNISRDNSQKDKNA